MAASVNEWGGRGLRALDRFFSHPGLLHDQLLHLGSGDTGLSCNHYRTRFHLQSYGNLLMIVPHGSLRLVTVSSPRADGHLPAHISFAWIHFCIGLLWLSALPCSSAEAQSRRALPSAHYFLNSSSAPGVVGGAQVARGVPGVGTFQAVSLDGPSGLKIGLAQDGQLLEPINAPVVTGMLVGATYRFRVTNIPFQPGQELYPTIEIIDKVFTPAGREHRFPIPVVLTDDDLRLALNGALVTRVIYLEDAEIAEPTAVPVGTQTVFEVPPTDNALQVADRLGRPVAILRIGSRVPNSLQGDLSGFLFGSPPWVPLPPVPERQQLIERGMWPEAEASSESQESPFSEPPTDDTTRLPSFR